MSEGAGRTNEDVSSITRVASFLSDMQRAHPRSKKKKKKKTALTFRQGGLRGGAPVPLSLRSGTPTGRGGRELRQGSHLGLIRLVAEIGGDGGGGGLRVADGDGGVGPAASGHAVSDRKGNDAGGAGA